MTIFCRAANGLAEQLAGKPCTREQCCRLETGIFLSLSKYNLKTNMDGFVLLPAHSIKCCILRHVDMKDGLCLQSTYASGLSQSLYVNSKVEPNPRCEIHICLRWNQMLIDACLFSSLCILSLYNICNIRISSSLWQYEYLSSLSEMED